MSKVIDETAFDSEVLKATKPVVVDFYADWCGPCVQQGPILEKWVAGKKASVEVVKVDVSNSQDLASRFGVQNIPTLIIFSGGQERGRAVGLQTERGLDALLARAATK